MRFKIQSEAPLPTIRSWYSYNPGPNATIQDLLDLISLDFKVEHEIMLSLQGFPLPTKGFVVDFIKEDDLLMYFLLIRMNGIESKRKRKNKFSSKKKLKIEPESSKSSSESSESEESSESFVDSSEKTRVETKKISIPGNLHKNKKRAVQNMAHLEPTHIKFNSPPRMPSPPKSVKPSPPKAIYSEVRLYNKQPINKPTNLEKFEDAEESDHEHIVMLDDVLKNASKQPQQVYDHTLKGLDINLQSDGKSEKESSSSESSSEDGDTDSSSSSEGESGDSSDSSSDSDSEGESEEKVQVEKVSDAEEKSVVQVDIDYTKLEPLLQPLVGERIAFKSIEMSESYTPEISDYKIGEIMNIEYIGKLRKELTIKLDKPAEKPKPSETWGYKYKDMFEDSKAKLEVPRDEGDQEDEADDILIIDFDALIEPKRL